jgi:hypothetical protein
MDIFWLTQMARGGETKIGMLKKELRLGRKKMSLILEYFKFEAYIWR